MQGVFQEIWAHAGQFCFTVAKQRLWGVWGLLPAAGGTLGTCDSGLR